MRAGDASREASSHTNAAPGHRFPSRIFDGAGRGWPAHSAFGSNVPAGAARSLRKRSALFCPSESPHVKIDDRRDGEVPRELPFNSFRLAHLQDDVRTHDGDARALASVRAVIDDVRMSSPRAQP